MAVAINICRTPAGPTSCYLDYSEIDFKVFALQT